MPPNGNVQATIDGDIQGQVAVGNYILQIGDVNGGVVNVAPQTQISNYTRRRGAVNLRPRPFTALLDREDETASSLAAIRNSAITVRPCWRWENILIKDIGPSARN